VLTILISHTESLTVCSIVLNQLIHKPSVETFSEAPVGC
jgi:hypothetical protein